MHGSCGSKSSFPPNPRFIFPWTSAILPLFCLASSPPAILPVPDHQVSLCFLHMSVLTFKNASLFLLMVNDAEHARVGRHPRLSVCFQCHSLAPLTHAFHQLILWNLSFSSLFQHVMSRPCGSLSCMCHMLMHPV